MKTRRKKLESPVKQFWRRVKRIILYCSALLFAGFLWVAYSELAPVTQSTAGKIGTSAAGMALAPVVDSLPWWFWAGAFGLAVYLWLKHKLVMSIVYGVFVGLWLAVM